MDKKYLTPGSKTVAFVIEDTDWGRGNAGITRGLFKADGWKTVTTETVSLGNTDFYPQLSKIKAMNPDILIISLTNLSSGVALVKQFHEIGLKCSLWAIYFPVRPEFIEQAGKSAEYLLFNPFTFDPEGVEKHKQFGEKVKKRWNKTVTIDHAIAYDNINNLIDSIERAGSEEPKVLVEAISNLDRRGIMGRWAFNKTNHAIIDGADYVPVASAQIINGKRQIIWPPSLSKMEYQTPPWMK